MLHSSNIDRFKIYGAYYMLHIWPIWYGPYDMVHENVSWIWNAQKALITNRGCDTNSIIVIICVALFFSGFAYAGFLNPNILDLAPNHAETLFGITNTFANMALIVAPQVAGYFIQGNKYTIDGWQYVWITSTAVLIFGGTVYSITDSAEKQPWADKEMMVKEQLSFELNQRLFRKSDITSSWKLLFRKIDPILYPYHMVHAICVFDYDTSS